MTSPTRMTIGQLAKETGVPIKTLREYERLGLLYTLGRSEGNYRLFDDSALWCVRVVSALRSLGLTLAQIQSIANAYLDRDEASVGPRLKVAIEEALRRAEDRIADLVTLRNRIHRFMADHAEALDGQGGLPEFGPDPRRTQSPSVLPRSG